METQDKVKDDMACKFDCRESGLVQKSNKGQKKMKRERREGEGREEGGREQGHLVHTRMQSGFR